MDDAMHFQQKVVDLLNARDGHFLLESGHHGKLWLELDSLFARPARTARLAAELARRLGPAGVEAVCGPLVGGALLAQAVGTQMDADLLYTEAAGAQERGGLYGVRYRLPEAMRSLAAGRAVAIVDDVANAGSATRATHAELSDAGARPLAIATLLTLGEAVPAFAREEGLFHTSLASLPSPLWEPEDCPLCAAGVPLEDRRQQR